MVDMETRWRSVIATHWPTECRVASATHDVYELPSNAEVGPSPGSFVRIVDPNEDAETDTAPTGELTV
jgi:hypothetical protein